MHSYLFVDNELHRQQLLWRLYLSWVWVWVCTWGVGCGLGVCGMGYRVWGMEVGVVLWVWGLGCGVWCLGLGDGSRRQGVMVRR